MSVSQDKRLNLILIYGGLFILPLIMYFQQEIFKPLFLLSQGYLIILCFYNGGFYHLAKKNYHNSQFIKNLYVIDGIFCPVCK